MRVPAAVRLLTGRSCRGIRSSKPASGWGLGWDFAARTLFALADPWQTPIDQREPALNRAKRERGGKGVPRNQGSADIPEGINGERSLFDDKAPFHNYI